MRPVETKSSIDIIIHEVQQREKESMLRLMNLLNEVLRLELVRIWCFNWIAESPVLQTEFFFCQNNVAADQVGSRGNKSTQLF